MSEQEKQCYEQGKCDALEAQKAEAFAERDQAIKERNNAVKTAEYLKKQLKDERESFNQTIRRYKKKAVKSLMVPCLVFGVFAVMFILVLLGTNRELIAHVLGEPLSVAMLCGCFFCGGLIYERAHK